MMKMMLLIALALAGTVPASAQPNACGNYAATIASSGPTGTFPQPLDVGIPNASSEDARPTHLNIPFSSGNCTSKLDSCDIWVNYDNNFDKAYDTLRKYLALCPNDAYAMSGLDDLSACIGSASQTKTEAGRLDLRSYLMSIRNISSFPGWYCDCVWMLGPTYTVRNAGLAILKYLLSTSRCSFFDSMYAKEYNSTRSEEYLTWIDTAKNDSIQYFDTTLPSLTMLGLDSLLADEASQGVRPNAPRVISNFSASPNPVEAGTVLSFGLTQEAYVKIELYDELGKLETGAGNGFAGALPSGNKSVPISLAGLPAGTYYARLQTAYGEVRTVKLVKE